MAGTISHFKRQSQDTQGQLSGHAPCVKTTPLLSCTALPFTSDLEIHPEVTLECNEVSLEAPKHDSTWGGSLSTTGICGACPLRPHPDCKGATRWDRATQCQDMELLRKTFTWVVHNPCTCVASGSPVHPDPEFNCSKYSGKPPRPLERQAVASIAQQVCHARIGNTAHIRVMLKYAVPAEDISKVASSPLFVLFVLFLVRETQRPPKPPKPACEVTLNLRGSITGRFVWGIQTKKELTCLSVLAQSLTLATIYINMAIPQSRNSGSEEAGIAALDSLQIKLAFQEGVTFRVSRFHPHF